MIVTSDPQIADRARLIRNHGSHRTYEHVMLGYNMRMTDLTAAIGLVQLKNLKKWNSVRQENAAYLSAKLCEMGGIVTPKVRDHVEHVFNQYTIRIPNRDQAAQSLRERGIGVGIYYPIPIHKQPLYQQLGYAEILPVAEAASQEVLSLPIHPSLTKNDLDMVIQALADL
jgi:dTDP-4-amino-4,6-dideoxygalactose transaminase